MFFLRRIFFVLLISLFTLGGFAQVKSLSLKEIDSLILGGDYNKALVELANYMKNNPDDFDRAQKRVTKVIKQRDSFNMKAEALVDAIRSTESDEDTSNSEKEVDLINDLRQSEKNQTEIAADFTRHAFVLVRDSYYRTIYNRIMNAGLQNVKEEKFSAAVENFLEWQLKNVKDENSDVVVETVTDDEGNIEYAEIPVKYDNDIVEGVNKTLDSIMKSIDGNGKFAGIKTILDECEAAYTALENNVRNQNEEAAKNSFGNVYTSFGKLAAVRNSILAATSTLKNYDKTAHERNPLLFEMSYITYFLRFLLGDENNINSGVIGALDAYYYTRVESMKNVARVIGSQNMTRVRSVLSASLIYSNAEKIDDQRSNLKKFSVFAEIAKDSHKLYENLLDADGNKIWDRLNEFPHSMDFVQVFVHNLNLAFDSAKDLSVTDKILDADNLPDVSEVSDDFVSIFIAEISKYEKIKNDSLSYMGLNNEERERTMNYYNLSEDSAEKNLMKTPGTQITDSHIDFTLDIEYFDKINEQNLSKSSARCGEGWSYIAKVYSSRADDYEFDFGNRFDYAEQLFNENKKENSDGIVKKSPFESLIILEKLNGDIAEAAEVLDTYIVNMETGLAYRKDYKEIDDGVINIQRVRSALGQKKFDVDLLTEKCEKEKAIAMALHKKGMNQYSLAQKLFEKEDFEESKAAIQSAADNLAEYLEHQYDDSIKVMINETLVKLGTDVSLAQNEKVLRNIYAFIDSATALYYESKYEESLNILENARKEWRIIHPDGENENVETLYKRVLAASKMSPVLELVKSDPLYPELSKSLEEAVLKYESGKFEEALSYVHYVKSVYPENQRANLIELRINRKIDKVQFDKDFPKMIATAKSKISSNNPDDVREGIALVKIYNELETSSELRKIISDFEERNKPKKPSAPKRDEKKLAQTKFNSAKQLYDTAGDDREKLRNVLNELNEVLTIDSTNAQAKDLRIKIQVKLDTPPRTFLTPDENKLFTEIINILNRNDNERFREANEKMQVLLKSPAAPYNKEIQKRNAIIQRGLKYL